MESFSVHVRDLSIGDNPDAVKTQSQPYSLRYGGKGAKGVMTRFSTTLVTLERSQKVRPLSLPSRLIDSIQLGCLGTVACNQDYGSTASPHSEGMVVDVIYNTVDLCFVTFPWCKIPLL